MSKAQRYKQQQKDAKKAKLPQPAKPAEDESNKTLKQRQLENKEALRKHQASMTRLKAFEEKLHPKPAGEAAPVDDGRTKSAIQDMFYDGGNLSKDASATRAVAHKDSPATTVRSMAPPAAGGHEKNTAIVRF